MSRRILDALDGINGRIAGALVGIKPEKETWENSPFSDAPGYKLSSVFPDEEVQNRVMQYLEDIRRER